MIHAETIARLTAKFPRASLPVLAITENALGDDAATLPNYGWPGGMPLVYFARGQYGEDTLCAECATMIATSPDPAPDDSAEDRRVYDVLPHEEGPPIECDECGTAIESGYGDPNAPDADAITTPDDRRFYQYGKLVLELTDDDDRDSHLRAYMDAQQFWPEVWSLSDHGNWTRIDIPPREVDAIRVDLIYGSIGEADDDETHAYWDEYRAELEKRLRQRYADADEIIVTYDDRSTGVTREPLIIAASPDAEAAARAELEYLQSTLFAELLREWES